MRKTNKITWILCAFYAFIIGLTLHEYLIADVTFVVGIAVLPFCFKNFTQTINPSYRYLIGLLPLLIMTILAQSYTIFYFTCVGAILLIWESRMGQLSALPTILFTVISPVFRYVTDVFSFDFRLKLTAFAAKMLQKIDPSVSPVGNLIKLKDGSEWQIDEACMGLNMLGVSFILSIFFIAYFADRQKKHPILRGIFFLLLITLVLNIFCNLLRIIALVHFKVLPHTIGHDLVGALALTIYVIVPMYFLTKKAAHYDWFFDHKIRQERFFSKNMHSWKSLIVNGLVLLVLLTKSFFLIYKKPTVTAETSPNITLQGFEKATLSNSISQFSNDSLLIYIKPLRSFYTTEHSPMVCWRGSGFEFKQIEKKLIGTTEIYTGILAKGDSTIYTAWWFENERGERTIEQKTWRWAAFTEGVHFRLVNVNAAHPDILSNFVQLNQMNKTQ